MITTGEGNMATMTREGWIHQVRALAVALVTSESSRERLLAAKLVYGAGSRGVRGVCYYGAWQASGPDAVEFIEVAATGEESLVQLAGTTIHETAHVLAGHGAGHGPVWKAACKALGLVHAEAAGQCYTPDHFAPSLWTGIEALPVPTDGKPVFRSGFGAGLPLAKPRPCPMGVGSRGGRSRGTGSGSRMRLYVCACTPDRAAGITNKVRVAADDWQATCGRCGTAFARVEAKADRRAA
jgi:hypothetical protein